MLCYQTLPSTTPPTSVLLLDYHDPETGNGIDLVTISRPRSAQLRDRIAKYFDGSGCIELTAIFLPHTPAPTLSVKRVSIHAASLAGHIALKVSRNEVLEVSPDPYKLSNQTWFDDSLVRGSPQGVHLLDYQNGDNYYTLKKCALCFSGGLADGNSVMWQWIASLALVRARSTQFLVQIVLEDHAIPYSIPNMLKISQGISDGSAQGAALGDLAHGSRSRAVHYFQPRPVGPPKQAPDDMVFWAWYSSPVPASLEKFLASLQSKYALTQAECKGMEHLFPTTEGFYLATYAPRGDASAVTVSLHECAHSPSMDGYIWLAEGIPKDPFAAAQDSQLVDNPSLRAKIMLEFIVSPEPTVGTAEYVLDWDQGDSAETFEVFLLHAMIPRPTSGTQISPAVSPNSTYPIEYGPVRTCSPAPAHWLTVPVSAPSSPMSESELRQRGIFYQCLENERDLVPLPVTPSTTSNSP